MARTANLDLPLVQAAQAQKHVTVNEALGLIDGLTQMTLESLTVAQEPIGAVDGQSWAVPLGATGAWSLGVGKLAVFSNGGWIFLQPKPGWRGWVKDTGKTVLYDGVQWQPGAVAMSVNRAATVLEVIEVDVTLVPGTTVLSLPVIPAASLVFGVTGRVTAQISGTLSAWKLGVSGNPGLYGSGLGLAQDSWAMGLSGQPQAYYAPTALQLNAENGNFSGGTVRLAVHLLRMTLPSS